MYAFYIIDTEKVSVTCVLYHTGIYLLKFCDFQNLNKMAVCKSFFMHSVCTFTYSLHLLAVLVQKEVVYFQMLTYFVLIKLKDEIKWNMQGFQIFWKNTVGCDVFLY